MFHPSVSCDYGLIEFMELTKHLHKLSTEQSKIVPIKKFENTY